MDRNRFPYQKSQALKGNARNHHQKKQEYIDWTGEL